MRGLKRGLLVGLVLAGTLFVLPDDLLGTITTQSGLTSVVPAAAPPLGVKARALLGLVAFVLGLALTLLVLRRRQPEWDEYDDSEEPAPLPASEQMVVAPAAAMAVPAPTSVVQSDLADRLARVEATVAAGDRRPATGVDDAGTLARIEALESSIGARLDAIEKRVITQAAAAPKPSADGIASAKAKGRLAEIRRTLDRR